MSAVVQSDQIQLPVPVARQCYACKLVLQRSAFSASTRNSDGILHICRECNRNHAKAWKRKNPDRAKERALRYARSPKGKAAASKWTKRDREIHPERHAARAAVFRAVQDGRLQQIACEVCGNQKSEAHHDDYTKPLDIRWLCRKHHQQYHAEIK